MDLCDPMRVASINGKRYTLVIVDDYSRYTWVYFLRSKDETSEIIKKFIAQAQLNCKAKVCNIRTDNGRHKDKVGMQIPAWMITKEMKHTEHYQMKSSALRSPNSNKEAAESSAPRRSTVIHFCIPERRSARLTSPAPVPNVDKADEMILQDTLQVSLAEHKSREEQEARETSVADVHPGSIVVEMKSRQIEMELWKLNVKGHNPLTATINASKNSSSYVMIWYQHRRLLDRYIDKEITVGDKRKWNGNHYNNNNPNTTSNLNPNKRPETARVFTAGQGSYVGKLPYCTGISCGRTQYIGSLCPLLIKLWDRAGTIRAKDCLAHPVPQTNRGIPNARKRTGK
ncbi:uncharacterized mitochondrial protein-like protein [Tanacetum coccineum]